MFGTTARNGSDHHGQTRRGGEPDAVGRKGKQTPGERYRSGRSINLSVRSLNPIPDGFSTQMCLNLWMAQNG